VDSSIFRRELKQFQFSDKVAKKTTIKLIVGNLSADSFRL